MRILEFLKEFLPLWCVELKKGAMRPPRMYAAFENSATRRVVYHDSHLRRRSYFTRTQTSMHFAVIITVSVSRLK